MDALGIHILMELKDCDPDLLDDLDYVRDSIIRAADEAGAEIVGHTFHKFHPLGVTGIVAIAESHISVHTWPEFAYAAADIFSCSETFKPREAAQLIAERFRSARPSITEIERGLLAARTAAPSAV